MQLAHRAAGPRGREAQLQAFLDQARESGPLLGGQCLGLGRPGVVNVEHGLHGAAHPDTTICMSAGRRIAGGWVRGEPVAFTKQSAVSIDCAVKASRT